MIGKVLSFNTETKEGEILGEDRKRYYFHIGEWLSIRTIRIGQKVRCNIEENEARNILLCEATYTFHLRIDFDVTS